MTTAMLDKPIQPEATTRPERVEVLTGTRWLDQFGDITLDRVIFDPTPGTATEADLIQFNERPNRIRCELVNRTLILNPMGHFESFHASILIRVLGNWQEDHMPGLIAGEQSMLRMTESNVRQPDICFHPLTQFGGEPIPREKVASYPALLCVEVLSESNTEGEMAMKIREYFASGTKLVWIVDPATETVRIYDAPDKPETFRQIGRTDTLDGGEVLPNFSIPVAKIFNI
ncbi:MAG: Uma2 family endonuclease [Planctomycetota bacterium]